VGWVGAGTVTLKHVPGEGTCWEIRGPGEGVGAPGLGARGGMAGAPLDSPLQKGQGRVLVL